MSTSGFRSSWQRTWPHIKQQAQQFALYFGGFYVFTNTICGFTICVGPSMIPTIDPRGELTLIDRLSYKTALKEYKVNDVVISVSMDDPKKTVCKRIRGVGGDVVFYRNKEGTPVVVKIPEGHVWLLGDNPENSNDSRYYGPVPLGLLQGRVFGKISYYPSIHISHIDTVHEIEEQSGAKKEELKKKKQGEAELAGAAEKVVDTKVVVSELPKEGAN